jgi:Arc/MetJ family transcription regulator
MSMCIEEQKVRTNIVIDEKLMKAAMKAAGTRTKRETVELGLRQIIDNAARRKAYDALLEAGGSGGIDPDYDIHAVRRQQRRLG